MLVGPVAGRLLAVADSVLVLGFLHGIEGDIGGLATTATGPIAIIRDVPLIESIEGKEALISGRIGRGRLLPTRILKWVCGVLGARHILVEELGSVCVLLQRAAFKLRVRRWRIQHRIHLSCSAAVSLLRRGGTRMILRIAQKRLLLLLLRIETLSFLLQFLLIIGRSTLFCLSPCIFHLRFLFWLFLFHFWLLFPHKWLCWFSHWRGVGPPGFFFLGRRRWRRWLLFLDFFLFRFQFLLLFFFLFFYLLFYNLIRWQLLRQIFHLQIILRWHVITPATTVTTCLLQQRRILFKLVQYAVKNVENRLSFLILSKVFLPWWYLSIIPLQHTFKHGQLS